MKNMKMKLIALMLMVIMVFTGCVSEKTEITINPDGSGNMKQTIKINKTDINKELKEQGATDVKIANFWQEVIKEFEARDMEFQNVTIAGKEYLQSVVSKKAKKGKIEKDLELSFNSYVNTDIFYNQIDTTVFNEYRGEEWPSLASLLDMTGTTVEITVTMPNDIVRTNGVISAGSKKTANFSLPLNKISTVFATTKSGVTQESVERKIKVLNTLDKPQLKKLKANKVKKNAKNASITVKWSKVKTAKLYNVVIATNKKFKRPVIDKYTRKMGITFKKLQKNTKYYVKIRAVKEDRFDHRIMSDDVVKTVKTKK